MTGDRPVLIEFEKWLTSFLWLFPDSGLGDGEAAHIISVELERFLAATQRTPQNHASVRE